MPKEKIAYVCSECGQEATKWVGRCPACGQWNTMKEIRLGPARKSQASSRYSSSTRQNCPLPVQEIEADAEPRIDLGDNELNRVLGGGLVPGSLVLLGGEPGIGKSTLILQTSLNLSDRTVLYVSGEESARQIKLRADRLNPSPRSKLLILCETSLDAIYRHVEELKPDLLIIDSIQTISSESLDSSPGSLSQIRECAASLLKFVKEGGCGCSVILIGHITKDGTLAGPKVLEHIVDCVLQFEGDQHYMYRILRGMKNRFGSTSELGIYEMHQGGLRQVANPSELLLTEAREGLSGIAICSAVEGIRPLLIETQALVSTAAYGTAQRSATGFDSRRLGMLLAVLEKRVGFKLTQKDVFLNIAGGLRVTDPAMDLSVILAVVSSNVDRAIDTDVCMCGEVGLSGEIRPVSRIEQRIAEAEKLGFGRMLVPAQGLKGIDNSRLKLKLIPIARVAEAVRELFG
ncbi:MAG: DNA repair protein RadA [Prevotellaceae bacterium]|nr:DNA repair protein RadA [Prevotellaceae bacterium]MCD8304236.1 DNA repair protein RadA [Prevotellaceae bacterium]